MALAWRRDADPNKWGVAVCTTDGQVFLQGDTDDYFSIQSSSKPLTYALALKERGEKFVHDYVGGEPAPCHILSACRTFSACCCDVERCRRLHEGSRRIFLRCPAWSWSMLNPFEPWPKSMQHAQLSKCVMRSYVPVND